MNDWQMLVEKAKKLMLSNQAFDSLGQRTKYRIKSVNSDEIVIARYGDHNDEKLSKKSAIEAINKLREVKVVKANNQWISRVAKRSAIVHLHPFIHWDNNEELIYWEEPDFELIIEKIKDAPDDVLERLQAEILKRNYQIEFKRNLLKLYNGKCAITSTTVTEVLEAAHILSYAKSGINSNDNGILLRSDLHRLYDKNLLAIDPETLKVHIHESLRGSYYQQFDGQRITMREDGSSLNYEYLSMRFDEFKKHRL